MTGAAPEVREPVTTSGTIAVTNLHAQIDGMAVRLSRAGAGKTQEAPLAVAQGAALIDLLNLRGHILGRVADYERAAELAEQLVHVAPEDGTALLARARARATLHRFAEAVADLGAAGRSGADEAALDAERAVVLQALGCYADALALIRTAAERQSDFTTLGALAVLQAERGEVTEAERLFGEARRHYQGTSPFPLAQLDFRRGVMWHREGELDAARSCYEAARRQVPDYAPALGHLAEVELLRGALRPPSPSCVPSPGSATTPSTPATWRLRCTRATGSRRRTSGASARQRATTN